jgi:putative tricarboxylic transport membrane protein
MKVPSAVKRLLLSAIVIAGILVGITGVRAADYPTKPITFIIPAAPGGAYDIDARLLIPALQQALGVTILPQNFNAGPVAPTQLYKARPDGYTIGIVPMPGTLLLQLMGSADFDVDKYTWLSHVAHETYALAVAANSPINSIAALKALGHPVSFTSAGPGSTAFAATQLAMHQLGVNGKIITGYPSAPEYILGVIRGDGDAVITNLTALSPYITSHQVKLLLSFDDGNAVPGVLNARAAHAPDLAKISLDTLVGAPPGLPPELRKRLSDAIATAIRDPDTQARAKTAGVHLATGDAAQAAAVVSTQHAFFSKNAELIGKP